MWPCNNKIEGNFLPIIQQNVSEFSSAYKNFHKQFILIFLFICAWLVFTDDHFENKLQMHITLQLVLFCPFTFFLAFYGLTTSTSPDSGQLVTN